MGTSALYDIKITDAVIKSLIIDVIRQIKQWNRIQSQETDTNFMQYLTEVIFQIVEGKIIQ